LLFDSLNLVLIVLEQIEKARSARYRFENSSFIEFSFLWEKVLALFIKSKPKMLKMLRDAD